MDQKLQDQITALQATVKADTDVESSAVALLTGLSTQLATAIASAKDGGATVQQLAALTDLNTAISGSTSTLAKAVTANTPVVV